MKLKYEHGKFCSHYIISIPPDIGHERISPMPAIPTISFLATKLTWIACIGVLVRGLRRVMTHLRPLAILSHLKQGDDLNVSNS